MATDAPDVLTGATKLALPGNGAGPRIAIGKVAKVKRRRSLLVGVAAVWLVVICLLAITADWLPLKSYTLPIGIPRQAPGFRLDEPLGYDELGRSQLSRVIFGARVSLAVGLASVTIGMVIGGLIGMIAGYFRGKVEAVVSIFTDATLAFPPLILLLAFTAILTQSLRTLIIALSILSIPSFARLARANTLVFAQREFVLAAKGTGARHARILFREILPNVVFPVASYAFIIVAAVMVAEGSLSFLGLGIPPPQPSWGGMVASGRDYLETEPWLVFVPAGVMLLTVLSFNILGDRARRRFDIRQSGLG
jgi:peptide/nickel transport system permease protein